MKLPQLSLRELFLLVVIAALGCGWWVDHRRAADSARWQTRAEILKAWIEGHIRHSYVVFERDNGAVEIYDGSDNYLMSRPIR